MAANWLSEEEETLQDALAEAGFGEGEEVAARVYQIHTNDQGGKLRGSFCFEVGPLSLDEVGTYDIEGEALRWATANLDPGPQEFQVTFKAGKTKQSRRFSVAVPRGAAPAADAPPAPDRSRAEILDEMVVMRQIIGGGERPSMMTPEMIAAIGTAVGGFAALFKGDGGGAAGPSVTEVLTLMESARTNGLKLGEELGESKAGAPTGTTPLDLGIAALNKLPETVSQLVAARGGAAAPTPAVTQAQPNPAQIPQTPPSADEPAASAIDPTPEETEAMLFQLRMTKLINLLTSRLEADETLTPEAILDLVDETCSARDRDALVELLEENGVETSCDFLASTLGEAVAKHVGEGGRIRAALALLVADDKTTEGTEEEK